LQALDEHGADLGVVVDILETGANDVLVVRLTDGQEIMVPYTDDYVPAIDLPKSQIHLHLLPGILPGT
jgi:16S rRNA processing protein RimM